MATIDDVATWCTSTVLNRTDLTTQARLFALEVYKTLCGKIPFEQLQVVSAELPCIAGTASYSLTSGPTILAPALSGIMSIRYTAAVGQMWRLRRSNTRTYDAVTYSTGSNPRTYARFGNSIEFMPAPASSSATFRIRYWSAPTIASPNPETTTLLVPDPWVALIQWETLYRLYYIIGQGEKAMQLMMPTAFPRQPSTRKSQIFEVGIIPRLWNDLLLTIQQREAVDEDYSVNPIVRAYTNG